MAKGEKCVPPSPLNPPLCMSSHDLDISPALCDIDVFHSFAGQHAEDSKILGKPIGRLVHFAGEHTLYTHTKHPATPHAAYSSGARAANDIIGNYFPNDKINNLEEKGLHSISESSCIIS